MVGNERRQPIDLTVGHLQDSACVLEHGAGLEFSERDELGDLVAAVFLLDVKDDLAAPGFAEIDVEVGHRHAIRVEAERKSVVEAKSWAVRGNHVGTGRTTKTKTIDIVRATQ